jgi:hypothetical protein
MKREAKNRSSAENWARAKSFLWHLDPPWRDKFSHEHWWNQPIEVSLESTMWERFRRHPMARQLNEKFEKIKSSSNENEDTLMDACLRQPALAIADFVCMPWPEFSGYRYGIAFWKRFLYYQVPPHLGYYPNPLHVVSEARRRTPTPRAVAEFVAECIMQAEHKRRILISVDPFADGLGKLVEKAAAEWRQGKPPHKKGKPHSRRWLKAISEFERSEAGRKSKEKRDERLFTQYRRTIDGFLWMPKNIFRK